MISEDLVKNEKLKICLKISDIQYFMVRNIINIEYFNSLECTALVIFNALLRIFLQLMVIQFCVISTSFVAPQNVLVLTEEK